MGQSKIESLVESLVNIAIGYFIGVASQLVIFPAYGVHVSIADTLGISAWFTVIAIARSYAVRRWFNRKGNNKCRS